MGPRSCERGNPCRSRLHGLDPLELQWGRARASAEILKYVYSLHCVQEASMGPRSCERGNASAAGTTGIAGSLGFNGAALVRARKCEKGGENDDDDLQSFNGAALVRARKSEEKCLRKPHPASFNGAALVRARKSQPRVVGIAQRSASMGPRSCERGNRSQRQPAVADYKLQWGRARASAEIPSPQARTKEGAKLQ